MFFCVYINDFLNLLESKGIECFIGPQYCGAFSYADDIILLCPSVKGTNQMLKIRQEYAISHFIKFNIAKSQFIVFPAKSDFKIENIFHLNDSCIPVVSKVKRNGYKLLLPSGSTSSKYTIY